jgi:hypothetical protein
MLNLGDEVYKKGELHNRGTVVNADFPPVVIVQYKDGHKEKVNEADLIKLEPTARIITPEKFDEAVKALMYGEAEKPDNEKDLDMILEVIGVVSFKLKERLFNGND